MYRGFSGAALLFIAHMLLSCSVQHEEVAPHYKVPMDPVLRCEPVITGPVSSDVGHKVQVHLSANCQVTRTLAPNEADSGLGWIVILNGKQVLHAAAEGDTQFDYDYQPGDYSIYVVQYIDGAYQPVSNVVTYRMIKDGSRAAPTPLKIDAAGAWHCVPNGPTEPHCFGDPLVYDKNAPRSKSEYMLLSVDEHCNVSRQLWSREGGHDHRDILMSPTWVIVKNGHVVLEAGGAETTFSHRDHSPGVYSMYLKMSMDDGYRTVSNVINYVIE